MDSAIVPKCSLILVTGVNGFIASHIADLLLEAGYSVRGSVRSKQRGAALCDHFGKRYGAGRFKLVVVEYITVGGAFDEAVKGDLAS